MKAHVTVKLMVTVDIDCKGASIQDIEARYQSFSLSTPSLPKSWKIRQDVEAVIVEEEL